MGEAKFFHDGAKVACMLCGGYSCEKMHPRTSEELKNKTVKPIFASMPLKSKSNNTKCRI